METISGLCIVSFPFFADCFRKIFLMDRIRIILCLQAHCIPLLIDCPIPSCFIFQEIGCINLNSRTVCPYFHDDTAFISSHFCYFIKSALVFQYPVMVVTISKYQWFIRCINLRSQFFCTSEIHRCSIYRTDFSCRYGLSISRGKSIR